MMEFNFKVTPNAEALFNNGEEFQKAAARCLGVNEDGAIEIVKDGVFITLSAPAVVNAAFACEMYLKALILKSGKNYPTNRDGHNLKKLYDMLSEPIQNHLYQFCVNKEDCAEIIFTSFLENHSRDFMDARYYVTKEGWQGMSPIAVYTYAFNLGSITKYGYMESVTILTKPPFDKPLSFTKLFDRKTQAAIMVAINKVKDNAIITVA